MVGHPTECQITWEAPNSCCWALGVVLRGSQGQEQAPARTDAGERAGAARIPTFCAAFQLLDPPAGVRRQDKASALGCNEGIRQVDSGSYLAQPRGLGNIM